MPCRLMTRISIKVEERKKKKKRFLGTGKSILAG